MNYRDVDPNFYTRRSTHRLPSYDYRSAGAYFITICSEGRRPVFEIPAIRTALLETWQHLPRRFPSIKLDEFVIMPDHIHCILWLQGSLKDAPTLGSIVGAYKSLMTISWRNYHKAIGVQCSRHLWQRDYYEHVIRNEEDLRLTREYILNNPLEALFLQEQRQEEARRARRNGRP